MQQVLTHVSSEMYTLVYSTEYRLHWLTTLYWRSFHASPRVLTRKLSTLLKSYGNKEVLSQHSIQYTSGYVRFRGNAAQDLLYETKPRYYMDKQYSMCMALSRFQANPCLSDMLISTPVDTINDPSLIAWFLIGQSLVHKVNNLQPVKVHYLQSSVEKRFYTRDTFINN